MSTISKQVLELQTLPAAELATRYAGLFGKPPRVRNVAWLRRQVAWKLQEREFGGLGDRARARLDELVAAVQLPVQGARARSRQEASPQREERDSPAVGTTLVREWRGQQLRVEVRENGFEWNGVLYRSLSAVAKVVTGSVWSGPLFFGLVERRSGS
jgi:hypothetical protein